MASEVEAGFASGTLGLGDKELVPIEQIRVGDVLLSRREMTGEVEYKPVVGTFGREAMAIFAISYAIDDEGGSSYMLHPTAAIIFGLSTRMAPRRLIALGHSPAPRG